MNARKIWTELFQKPAGRLILFLLVGGIFLAFILMRRTPQAKPDNTHVASQATQAKSYSFKEDIQPPSRTEATSSPMPNGPPTPAWRAGPRCDSREPRLSRSSHAFPTAPGAR